MTPKKEKTNRSTARIRVDRVIESLQATNGNISAAAKAIGVSRNVIYSLISKNPKLQQIVIDARESIVDYAENALLQAIAEKQGWAVCFTLKTLGKSRGYVEQMDQQLSGQVEIVIRREDRRGTTNQN